MSKYIYFDLLVIKENDAEILIGMLDDNLVEGIEEYSNGIKVYVLVENKLAFETSIVELKKSILFDYSVVTVEEQNWNVTWESNFEPVIIEQQVGIRALFHQPIIGVEHEIVIQPKMSFGTGHHQTTSLMLQLMKLLDFKNKQVLDCGSGTGILAIYAMLLGASSAIALDNDEWCYENAQENSKLNNISGITCICGEITTMLTQQFDIIIANIHKNFHLQHLVYYEQLLQKNCYIMLSGFYLEDVAVILAKALEHHLIVTYEAHKDNWCCMILKKI